MTTQRPPEPGDPFEAASPPPTEDRPAPQSPPARPEVPVGAATPLDEPDVEPAADLTPPPADPDPDLERPHPVKAVLAASEPASPALTPPATGALTSVESAQQLTPPAEPLSDADLAEAIAEDRAEAGEEPEPGDDETVAAEADDSASADRAEQPTGAETAAPPSPPPGSAAEQPGLATPVAQLTPPGRPLSDEELDAALAADKAAAARSSNEPDRTDPVDPATAAADPAAEPPQAPATVAATVEHPTEADANPLGPAEAPPAPPVQLTPPPDNAAETAASAGPDPVAETEANEPVTGGAMPIPRPPVSRPPAGSAYGYPTRYAEAPGSGHFQLALPQLGTIVAGPAAGSMIAGIAAILVAFAIGCAAVTGTVMIPVATTVLTVFFMSTAAVLAAVALRQIKRGGGEYRGRGMAIAGLACAGGALPVMLGMLLLLLVVVR